MQGMKRYVPCLLLMLAIVAAPANAQTRRRRPTTRRPAPTKTAQPACPPSAAITTPTGLTYLITRHGPGRQPQAGETVVVHYTGTLTDGTKFDSSRDRGSPIEFALGQGQVIKGWDEALAQLHVGDQAVLIIPPTLGYGARGAGGAIPPDATLIFIVELVDVR
jgi:peptidylprolyl isomerase